MEEELRKLIEERSINCTGLHYKKSKPGKWTEGSLVDEETYNAYYDQEYEINKQPTLKQYNGNNGNISYVDKNGQIYVTRSSFDDMGYTGEILRKNGYTENSGLFVPLSNGEEIIHDDRKKEKWEQIKKLQYSRKNWQELAEKREKQEALQKFFDAQAVQKGIKPLSEDFYKLTINIDGLKIISEVDYSYAKEHNDNEHMKKTIHTVTSPAEYDAIMNISNIGRYNIINGMVSVIAQDGKCYCGPYFDYIEEMLKEANYKLDEKLLVPLAGMGGTKYHIIDNDKENEKLQQLYEIQRREIERNKYEQLLDKQEEYKTGRSM